MATTRSEIEGLTTWIVEPYGAAPPTTAVMLHGFGAPGHDLVALAEVIDAPVRFVFPEAPLELGGPYGAARAWWILDLEALADPHNATRDHSAEIPDGLAEARARVRALISALPPRPGRLVIGGFSQGAMLGLDVALDLETPPAGLILMSGTLIADAVWRPRMPRLAGVPVMLSHGRHDPLLSFAAAEQLRDRLVAGGAAIDWQPFDGGHEIPPRVLAAAATLLHRLA